MKRQRGSRVRRAARRLLVLVVAVAVLGGVAVVGRLAWLDGRLNSVICDGPCGPEFIAAPDGLVQSTPAARAVSSAPDLTPVDPDAVLEAVAPALDDDALGRQVGFAAGGTQPGDRIASAGDGILVPASTTKVLTAVAALDLMPPQSRFTTTVVDGGDDRVVLVGGGDPYLTARRDGSSSVVQRADLVTLADRTAASLQRAGRDAVTVEFDDGLFTGPSASPGWESDYVSGQIVTPISALWVDTGISRGVRTSAPAEAAAEQFADLLRSRDIDVADGVDRVEAPDGATTLGAVRSATVAQIVETLIARSDNEAAEVMLRHTAIAAGNPATFAGGAEAVATSLSRLGVDTEGLQLFDGSGLSRSNQVSPATLVGAVRSALDTPGLAAAVDNLPLSGVSGTLDDRFDDDDAGLVRAKTGTLTGIHSLAGYALDADGRPVAFAIMADRAPRDGFAATREAIEDVAAVIASCSCGT
ncbi:D-alanyl-D-alanine carboxypeptidase/D-alanyl-D-alanine endopeptidase [Aeromicrobium sp. CF3.5]|uniref:D-alanyl-D-alanine carboxypeptidase/D-alanyl-D-alanine endopeptidase n=1 Tax=Aeromicrobium sp. CF3.5 TaxID=3373078 RepID=UPI003EE65172